MHTEILILAWGAVLLFVHIFAAGHVKTRQYGTKWNTGARDEALPPMDPIVGRMVRAQANYQETFPIAIVALLGVVAAGRTGDMTALGGWIWLGARVVYLPLYALGVPVVRSLVFLVSVVGLAMVLWPLLGG
ncbi:MAPEG family protein [Novosphingobium sp. JCM 18896]|uniref:MAPEG family protein n=1 Tax=Novosphingobium sp. JCM 18896 TaxID=2989731 RepID=UPI0022215FCF|nr:MAPEG family protein [Novosphingobium sp. JCM 18896]MCW1428375.1 MAPEG family protein [Novosphingobium sp. JCM 18896]